MSAIQTRASSGLNVKNEPDQEAYVDFTPWSANALQEHSPSRKCAYDDVYYYLSKWVSDPKAPIPHGPALIIKQLALLHTMSVIEYLKRNFNSLEYGLRKNWSDMQHVTGLEKTLTELFSWNLHLSEYCEHAEAALDGVRILPNHETGATEDR